MPDRSRHTPNRVIRVDEELWRAAQAKAAARSETVSEAVRRYLRQYTKEK